MELGFGGDGTEGMEPNDCREVPIVGLHEPDVVERGFLVYLLESFVDSLFLK